MARRSPSTAGPPPGGGGGAGRARPSRIGPAHLERWGTLLVAVILALVGALLVVGGAASLGQDPLLGLGLAGAGAFCLAGAEGFRRLARPDGAPLTVEVGADDIRFERDGAVVGLVPRDEVGVVVLEDQTGHGGGVVRITVWGPAGALVGRWDTSWLGRGSIGAYRVLRRHGWPRAIEDFGTGRARWVSEDAPPWMGSRRGLDAYLQPEARSGALDPQSVDWAQLAGRLDLPSDRFGPWPEPAGTPPVGPESRSTDLRISLPLPDRWCVLPPDEGEDALVVGRYVDSLLARTPGMLLTRQELIDSIFLFVNVVRHLEGFLVAFCCAENASAGFEWSVVRVTLSERDPGRPVASDLSDLAAELAVAQPADRYPPRVRQVDGALGRGVRMHAVRDEPDPVDPAEAPTLRFVLRHWIPVPDRPYTVEVEATTDNVAGAAAVAADVDAAVATMTVGLM